jgi:hypothetical protein
MYGTLTTQQLKERRTTALTELFAAANTVEERLWRLRLLRINNELATRETRFLITNNINNLDRPELPTRDALYALLTLAGLLFFIAGTVLF